jgi:hypothetical protein
VPKNPFRVHSESLTLTDNPSNFLTNYQTARPGEWLTAAQGVFLSAPAAESGAASVMCKVIGSAAAAAAAAASAAAASTAETDVGKCQLPRLCRKRLSTDRSLNIYSPGWLTSEAKKCTQELTARMTDRTEDGRRKRIVSITWQIQSARAPLAQQSERSERSA